MRMMSLSAQRYNTRMNIRITSSLLTSLHSLLVILRRHFIDITLLTFISRYPSTTRTFSRGMRINRRIRTMQMEGLYINRILSRIGLIESRYRIALLRHVIDIRRLAINSIVVDSRRTNRHAASINFNTKRPGSVNTTSGVRVRLNGRTARNTRVRHSDKFTSMRLTPRVVSTMLLQDNSRRALSSLITTFRQTRRAKLTNFHIRISLNRMVKKIRTVTTATLQFSSRTVHKLFISVLSSAQRNFNQRTGCHKRLHSKGRVATIRRMIRR